MISLVLDRHDHHAFETLATQFTPMIRSTVTPFVRDGMLSRTEDADSLTNLCLWKLYQAYHDFKYEDDFSEEHNERRFIALVKRYITNILIDQQYSANLGMRKPAGGLISTAQIVSEDDEDEYEYDPCNLRQPTPYHIAVAKELRDYLSRRLDKDEMCIASLLFDGYSAEGIARKIGMQISRVRYLIYSRIQPQVGEFCG